MKDKGEKKVLWGGEGDMVCVLLGDDVPYVFRNSERETGEY